MSPSRPSRRPLLTVLVLGALLAATAVSRAGEEDDLERLRAELARISAENAKTGKILDELERKSRLEYELKGYSCFIDQSHWVKTKYLDSGWSVPLNPYASTFGKVIRDGVQAAGTWKSRTPGAPERAVVAKVFRYAHQVVGSDPPAPASVRFDPEGEPIPHSKPLLLVKELHRIFQARLLPAPAPPPPPPAGKPAPEVDPALALRLKDARASSAPASRPLGLMKYQAVAQGTLKETGKRTRQEWYAWSGKDSTYKGKDVTWLLVVSFDESTLDQPNQVSLGRDFAEAIATY
jgi:hypothetical protein